VDVTGTAVTRCAACRAPLVAGDRFCEQCGARIDDEPEHPAGDRLELDRRLAAAVSDRGLVHMRNEDAFALEVIADHSVAAVVCDGISSSSAGNMAARSAARAAADVLVAALAGPVSDVEAATVEAAAAAHSAVQQVPWTTRADRGMPSCTLVSAWCHDGEIVIGSAGDSRAYWIEDGTVQQLTVDDSWAQEQVDAGNVEPEQAFADPRAHSITNWIGPDAPQRRPRVVVHRPTRPGRLLLCSDGLWNYTPTADRLGELVEALPSGASAAAVARALVDMAVSRGGRDNITVVVADIQPRPGGPDEQIHR
jgi:PPM family protein phosphatase